MTKREIKIIVGAIDEYKKAVEHYHAARDHKSHEVVSEGLRALKGLAERLGLRRYLG
ncbi:hypothetical protein [Desulfotomaculum sp. 1211_IL3151]|uniref:hypothetical protein n=1 Tax=Desulfotomaculum sp. 1211_IL3151 TaxID=3084055 RepID=UPI002FDB4D22